jgi:aminopeptidase YwaD
VGGAVALTALCSEFPALGDFVGRVSAACGVPMGVFLPLMENSDHANFAAHGIPALRLVAGFDELRSNLWHVLTAADTRDKVQLGELRLAAVAAASLTWAALTASDAALAALRVR